MNKKIISNICFAIAVFWAMAFGGVISIGDPRIISNANFAMIFIIFLVVPLVIGLYLRKKQGVEMPQANTRKQNIPIKLHIIIWLALGALGFLVACIWCSNGDMAIFLSTPFIIFMIVAVYVPLSVAGFLYTKAPEVRKKKRFYVIRFFMILYFIIYLALLINSLF